MPSFDTRTIARVAAAAGTLAIAGCQHLRPIKYSVHGAVAEPGDYTSVKAITLNEAIAKAGGLTEEADPRAINITYGYIGAIVPLESQGTRQIEPTTSITVPTQRATRDLRRTMSRTKRDAAD